MGGAINDLLGDKGEPDGKCLTSALGINAGKYTCNEGKPASEGFGQMCWRTKLSTILVQGCDGSGEPGTAAATKSMCASMGCPSKCCTIPITEQLIICAEGFDTEPTEADFADCTAECKVDTSGNPGKCGAAAIGGAASAMPLLGLFAGAAFYSVAF